VGSGDSGVKAGAGVTVGVIALELEFVPVSLAEFLARAASALTIPLALCAMAKAALISRITAIKICFMVSPGEAELWFS
jgi:multisubunit Na+/H+ antiporter MnhG subunit